MCLAVDSTVPGQDVIATGSKDHYIKVCPCNSSKKKRHLLFYFIYLSYMQVFMPTYTLHGCIDEDFYSSDCYAYKDVHI